MRMKGLDCLQLGRRGKNSDVGEMFKKNLSQNFLIDNNLAERLAKYAGIFSSETILEIGPGYGIITRALASRAGKLIAVEKDRLLAERLEEKNFPNTEIICADILDFDFERADKIVANIPFKISSAILEKIFQARKPAFLILQKEFAERLIAKPGERIYSKLSVAANYFCDCKILENVSAKKFKPAPRVDAAVVRILPKEKPFEADENFWKIVDALFRHKKKIVRAALRDEKISAQLPKELAEKRVFCCDLKDLREICENIQTSSLV